MCVRKLIFTVCTVLCISMASCDRSPTEAKDRKKASEPSKVEMPEDRKLLFDLSDKVFARNQKLGFAGLTSVEQTFHCVWSVEAEVNNGGFDQYFWNSSGDVVHEAPGALERIGAPKAADIVRRANAVFKDGKPPQDRNMRQQELEAAGQTAHDKLDKLDREFYKCPDNLEALLLQFVIKHRDKFHDP